MPRPRVGTVAPDGAGGWRARITLPSGERPWIAIPNSKGMSEPMARTKAAVYSEKAAKGATFTSKRGAKVEPSHATIADIAAAWLKLLDADPKLAPGTKAKHRACIKTAVLPKLGKRTPAELTSGVLRQWVRAIQEPAPGKPAPSPSIVHGRYVALSKMLEDAISEEWVALAANPLRSRKVRELLPVIEVRETEKIAHLTEAQASQLIRATQAPERRLRYLLGATTGLREGETSALLWSSLATESGIAVVRVRDALAMVGPEGFGTRKAPKTRASKRTIPVHSALVLALAGWRAGGWRARVGREPTDDDPLFPDRTGAPWRPTQAGGRFRLDLKNAGLPTTFAGADLDTRSLRRSFATWLESHDVPGDHIDRLLGHSRSSVRARHYSGSDVGALLRAVETIRLDLGDSEGGESSGESSNRSGAPSGGARKDRSTKLNSTLVEGTAPRTAHSRRSPDPRAPAVATEGSAPPRGAARGRGLAGRRSSPGA